MKKSLYYFVLFLLFYCFGNSLFFAQETDIPLGNSQKINVINLLKEDLSFKGTQAIIESYKDIKEKYPEEFIFAEDELITLGKDLFRDGKVVEAFEIQKLNSEVYPHSWKVFENLGEIYCSNGMMFQKATENFQKALQLHPNQGKGSLALERMMGLRNSGMNETQEEFNYKPGENTGINAPYLGQEPPGIQPKVFAPGILSTKGNFELSCSFSLDGREVYYSVGGKIMFGRWEKEGWTAPKELWSIEKYGRLSEPHLNTDGQKLFFNKDGAIWYSEKINNEWSEPIKIVDGIYATVAINGNIYLTDISALEENVDLAFSEFADESYTKAERLSGEINTPYGDAHPCISPDESYILFDSARPGGFGWSDLYVSFRRENGTWGSAINLGESINTTGNDLAITITPDGEYLFFTRNNDIYWVDSGIIEQLKNENHID